MADRAVLRVAAARMEEAILRIAARQHGLVTRRQLLSVGLGADAIQHRIDTRRLLPVLRGVYRVGPLVAPAEREMAALLACGEDAFISGRSAAALWKLLPAADPSVPVDVTLRSLSRRRRPGIKVRCTPGLSPDEVTTIDGIRLTTPARTLLDLATDTRGRLPEQALARGEREGLVSHAELTALLDRHPRRRGTGVLRALVQQLTDPKMTRSVAEERFLALIERSGLGSPETNATVAGVEVDFFWRTERLVVEVDGFAYHRSRSSFVGDRRKGARLSARGVQVVRVTWDEVVHTPEAMLVRLAQALATTSLD